MKTGSDFDQTEDIFKDILVQLSDEEIRQEIITYHTEHASVGLVFLQVCFTDAENKIVLYNFTSYEKDGFKKWILDGSNDPDQKNLEYNMSDYATAYAE